MQLRSGAYGCIHDYAFSSLSSHYDATHSHSIKETERTPSVVCVRLCVCVSLCICCHHRPPPVSHSDVPAGCWRPCGCGCVCGCAINMPPHYPKPLSLLAEVQSSSSIQAH